MSRKRYFKGWYYKQEKGDQTVAFIPAFHFDGQGKGSASVQVITGERSWNFPFPIQAVRGYDGKDTIQIGNNYFSPKGIRVDLKGREDGKIFRIRGRLSYGSLLPLRYDICGPLRLIPGMQCRHGVVSMSHKVRGHLTVEGERLDFNGGRGYLEKDWGSSFPDWYVWCQAGWADWGECSLMAAAAGVKIAGIRFPGCIACVSLRGKEYRFATYLGARIRRLGGNRLLLTQGRMRLDIRMAGKDRGRQGQKLRAPDCGSMDRTVREKVNGRIWCRLWIGERLLTEYVGRGSFEQS